LTIDFTNTSARETSWSWDFGDGATSSQQNPTHLYAEAGDYVVRLTVSGPGGTDFVEQTVTVSLL
jgi:PKD repeat protein